MICRETEKSILATVIEYSRSCPNLIDILFKNCAEGDFKDMNANLIFKGLGDFVERKSAFDFATIMDLLKGKVGEAYFTSMLDCLRGTYEGIAEQFLREKISWLKGRYAQVALLKEIDDLARENINIIDWDKIGEIAQKAKLVRVKSEDSSFRAAYREYVSWKETKRTCVNTGFPTFDKLTDDYQYGEIIAIMARTTVGKTFLGLNILSHLINSAQENKIGFFSLEMDKGPLAERMMQIYFNLSRHEVHSQRMAGGLNEDEFLKRHDSLRVYKFVYSVAEIERLVEKDGLKIIFIDFLQLIKAGSGSGSYEVTTNKIVDLKELAKNRGLIIFLLVQISRKGGGGWEKVTIDMARESGAIEEICDFIIGMWDPNLNPRVTEKQRAESQGNLYMKLLKNKRGPTVFVEAKFSRDSGRILEIEEKEEKNVF
jgi:replicative DNA helicase